MSRHMEVYTFMPVLLFQLVEGRQCWYSDNGRTKVFFCAANQQCCGEACCWLESAFYTLWYFWLTVLLLLLLCAAGIYWIRRNYIYHRLLAVPSWNSRQLAQHTLRAGSSTGNTTGATPVKNPPEKIPEPLALPPYTPPVNPPPYTETDPGGPPLYSRWCGQGEKSTFMEANMNRSTT